MRKYFSVIIVLILFTLLAVTGAFPVPAVSAQENANSKISGLLDLQVQAKVQAKNANPLVPGQVNTLGMLAEESGISISQVSSQRIFLYSASKLSQAQMQELQAMGLTLYPDSWIPPVGNHPSGFITADMPVDKLSELSLKGYVVRLDTAERVMEAQNDLANQKMNADDVWTSGYTGTGVTVAVLDSGLDLTHPDIPAPTAKKDYSSWPVLDDTIKNTVTGHGTHVADSVLGRAANTAGSTYNGSAPGANLVFLKIGNDVDSTASSDAMINAIHAAVDTYSAKVITMSYGGWDDYHDGSSAASQAVDYAVSQGAVVFISAGNNGNKKRHYSGTVPASSSTDYIQVNFESANNTNSALRFNLVWYDGIETHNDLALEYYNSSQTLMSSTNGSQSESERGTENEISWYNSTVPNGNSTWYLKVHNYSTNSQFFHIYEGNTGYGALTFQNPDPNYTISYPADADSAISVGAYTTRETWYDFRDEQLIPPEGVKQTLNQIANFSSLGPRVDTIDPYKINIVAPGSEIISARDNDIYTWALRTTDAGYLYIDNNGPNRSNASGGSNGGDVAGSGAAVYIVMEGTSMAAPHAAGAAALILNKNPTWTPAQVKHAMEANAVDNGTSGFDTTYGWGLVDALAAANSIPPVTASYSDAAHNTVCDNFNDFSTKHTAFIAANGLHPNYPYKVAYYAGDTKKLTEDVTSGASGNISSQHTFDAGTDTPGTWHAVVSESYFSAPTSYNGTWAYTISSHDFTVQNAAIPEFPNLIAAIVIPGLCFLLYVWKKRRAALNYST